MIIGSFHTKTKDENLKHFQCNHCGGKNINVKVFSTFFNLGFPLFPTGKKIETTCNDCKKNSPIVFNESNFQKLEDIKSESNHPFYLYIFPALFGLIFLYNIFNVIVKEFDKPNTEFNVIKEKKSNAEIIKQKEFENYKKQYNELLFNSSILPEHPAAEYIVTHFQKNIHGNEKLVEAEAESFDNTVLLVCYIPNIKYSTEKAKKELLEKTTKLLQNKFNYDNFYIAFYGYDINLYAIKSNDMEQTSQSYLSTQTEKLLYDFYKEKEKKISSSN